MRLASNLSRTATVGPSALSPAEQAGTYLAFYGLSKPPFGATGDRGFFMLFNAHRPAFERLVAHMLNGSGLLLLLGEDGCGKSALLDTAAQVASDAGSRILRPDWPAAGRIDAAELLAASGDGAAEPGCGPSEAAGSVSGTARPVLLVDNAERLTPAAWASVAALPRKRSDRLAIVASMHPQHERLAETDCPRIRIPALSAMEIRQYIERSLWLAGGTSRRLMAPEALRLIVSASNGRPGAANRLMEGAFTAGFVRGDTKITARTVAAVLPAHRGKLDRRWTDGILPPVFGAGLLLIGLSAFLYKGLTGGGIEPGALPSLEHAGDARAATEVGKAYDPNFGANPADAAQAAAWYRKAIALGDPRASELLRRLLGHEADGQQ